MWSSFKNVWFDVLFFIFFSQWKCSCSCKQHTNSWVCSHHQKRPGWWRCNWNVKEKRVGDGGGGLGCHTGSRQPSSVSRTTWDGTCHTLVLTPLSPMATAGLHAIWRLHSHVHACVCACACACMCAGVAGEVMRCQHSHVTARLWSCGVVVASAFNWLIVVIIWAGRSSQQWGWREGHSHAKGTVPL